MTFKPSKTAAKLVNRLTLQHGIEFEFKPEQYGIYRDQQSIRMNVLEGLDEPTWRLSSPSGYERTKFQGSQWCSTTITSNRPVSWLLASHVKWDLELQYKAIWGHVFIREGEPEPVNRYWVSWWSQCRKSAGCIRNPPFQVWYSGYGYGKDGLDVVSICAVIDAPSEAHVEKSVAHFYPDYEMRFINPAEPDWRPGDRFPMFLGMTYYGGFYVAEDYS